MTNLKRVFASAAFGTALFFGANAAVFSDTQLNRFFIASGFIKIPGNPVGVWEPSRMPAFAGDCVSTAGGVTLGCSPFLAIAHSWPAAQTFSTANITGGAINGTPTGQTTPTLGNFTHLATNFVGTPPTDAYFFNSGAAGVTVRLQNSGGTADFATSGGTLYMTNYATGGVGFSSGGGSYNFGITGFGTVASLTGTGLNGTNIGQTTPGKVAASNLSVAGTLSLPANSVTLPMVAQAPAHTLRGNPTGATANVSDGSLSSYVDDAFGSTQGQLLCRGPSGWTVIPAGTSGYLLTANGAGVCPSYQATAGGGVTVATGAQVQAGTDNTALTSSKSLADSGAIQTLTDGATISWDMSQGYNAKVTLGGNRAIANPTNAIVGRTYTLQIIQDGTGSRTLAWGTAYNWGTAGVPALTTTAGKTDTVSLFCVTTSNCQATMAGQGF